MRVLVHLERVLAVGDQAVALLRDDRSEQDLVRMERHLGGPPLDERQRASVISSARAQTTVATSSSDGTVTSTPRQVAERLDQRLLAPRSTTSDERHLLAPATRRAPWPASSTERSKPRAVEHAERAVAAAWLESAPRSAERRALRFTFTSKLRIVGAKTTPPPVNCGGADRAGAGAAGALLAPRLRAAAGDEAAGLGAARAGAAGVQLGADGLVHEVRLHARRRRSSSSRETSLAADAAEELVPSERPSTSPP